MGILKRIFDFYLQSSMHVALSVYALIRITELVFHLLPNPYMAGFGFFGTVVGYNFVKYDALARAGKPKMALRLKVFIAISALAFIGAVFCFFELKLITQIVSGICLLITALYTLPFFPNRTNARSWSGLKIYIVSLCWTGVTVVLPILNAGIGFASDFYIVSIKRFILIVVLLFIFEIIDLAWDDPHLKTVPQQIGIKNTKKLGVFLLIIFLLLELFQMNESRSRFVASVAVIFVTSAFLYFANEKRSRYYTAFWAESIPFLWWILLLAFA
jgi:1,4-dihydroxy-2-naphthoate octaprenyltransferase